jgi:hypothetical protein
MFRKLVICVCFTLSVVGCAAQQHMTCCKDPDCAVVTQAADAPAAAPKAEHPVLDECKHIVRIVTAPIWVPILIVIWLRVGVPMGC